MKVTTLEEYGVRCALQLARNYDHGPYSASQIASREQISSEYVGKIMHLFKKVGIVEAERGNQGGFFLTQKPADISLKRVFDALGGKKKTTLSGEGFCEQYSGQADECVHHMECSLRPVWQVLTTYFDDLLHSLSLADLLSKEQGTKVEVERLAKEKINRIVERLRGAAYEGVGYE